MAVWYSEQPITNLSFKKTILSRQWKIDVVEITFHVSFLVLKSIERKN